jgi:hypothetical protein
MVPTGLDTEETPVEKASEMFGKERQWDRAARRVKPGNGRPLKPFRWWQPTSRSLYYLRVKDVEYAVDVGYLQRLTTDDGSGKAFLYRDGTQIAESKLPAAFPVPGGRIEVAQTDFGLKRCHYVTEDGTEEQFVPNPASAEGRRARLDRERPALSRLIGFGSLLLVIIPSAARPADRRGGPSRTAIGREIRDITSPVELPLWLNVTLGVAASPASVERGSRMRYSRLLDES